MHSHSHTPSFSHMSPLDIVLAFIFALLIGGVLYYFTFLSPVQ